MVRATTAYRYGWLIDHYLVPHLGDVTLDRLQTDHLDDLYEHLIERGGRDGRALSPKTVHEAHLIVRNALGLALRRRLVDHNVALAVHSPQRRSSGSIVARVWNPAEVAAFLELASPLRLHPALHLTGHGLPR